MTLEVEGPPELVAFIAEEFRSLPGSRGWLALLYKALVVEEPGPDLRLSEADRALTAEMKLEPR